MRKAGHESKRAWKRRQQRRICSQWLKSGGRLQEGEKWVNNQGNIIRKRGDRKKEQVSIVKPTISINTLRTVGEVRTACDLVLGSEKELNKRKTNHS